MTAYIVNLNNLSFLSVLPKDVFKWVDLRTLIQNKTIICCLDLLNMLTLLFDTCCSAFVAAEQFGLKKKMFLRYLRFQWATGQWEPGIIMYCVVTRLLWLSNEFKMCCTTAEPSTESQREQPADFKWSGFPGILESGEQRALHCRTMGSCLSWVPLSYQTSPPWQWKGCAFAYMSAALSTI